MENSEKILAQEIFKGNKKAFEKVFHIYYQTLCNFAFQYLKDKEASEEIVQDIFFNIWDKRNTLSIDISLKSYLFNSVRNRCLNQLKHIETREKYKQHNDFHIKLSETHETNYTVTNELSSLIHQSINELPQERRKIFIMSRDEGLKNREIAEKLNISIKTVENQMGKALKFLREQLVDYLPVIIAGIYFLQKIKL